MKLPNHDAAIVPEAKIVDYLLSLTHRVGRGKAIFFMQFGFVVEEWEKVAEALLAHAADHEIIKTELSPFGTRYVIEGEIETPSERTPMIRAVWFIEKDSDIPRFVTAYPLKEAEDDDDTPRT
jgi:hypothetical protein